MEPKKTSAATGMMTLERVFDAPRELVWRAWTEPELVSQWYGPSGFTIAQCDVDLRPGGKFLWCMRSGDGLEFRVGGMYQEVDPPKRFLATSYMADEDGNMLDPAAMGWGDEFPNEISLEVTLEELDGMTKMTMVQGMPVEMAEQTGAVRGWGESFDKMDRVLARL